ncbi:MAG: hypothetical protein HUJ29_00465 [Gammaproteobacteria bacterium]|nr:hypothetical protein [Gammaproteobacteria bacterium]
MTDEENLKLKNESDYQKALETLSKASQPPAILCLLMRAFERYRAARKMGWSRPWNKYDLLNFQSFRLRPHDDRSLIDLGQRVIRDNFSDIPDTALSFMDELLSDNELMGFVFCHEYNSDGRNWEGATLSVGRKVQRRYRDRLDILVESEVCDSKSIGLSRLRIYIDPYRDGVREPLWQDHKTLELSRSAQELFEQLSEISWQWAQDETRRWDHWTSRYIDYFGERQYSLDQSYFYLPANEARQNQRL